MRAIEASRISSISILLSMGNLLFISVERRAPPQSPSQVCSIMFFYVSCCGIIVNKIFIFCNILVLICSVLSSGFEFEQRKEFWRGPACPVCTRTKTNH
jgi:hypothetical protein